MRADCARRGYTGSILRVNNPLVTPWDTRMRLGAVGADSFGTDERVDVELMMPPMTPPNWPPGIPPGTPPTTPAEDNAGGASSSRIICTFCGMRVGVRKRPSDKSLVTRCTTLAAASGAAGGGGG